MIPVLGTFNVIIDSSKDYCCKSAVKKGCFKASYADIR